MKKVEKRLFSVALSIILIIAMGITTFAAQSPSADGVVTVNSGKDANGKEIYYTVESVAAEYQSAAEAIKDKNNLKAALGASYVDGMEVVDVRSIVLHEKAVAQAATYAENGDEVGDDGYVAFPLTLTFNVPGVVKGTKIAVLAYVNGVWQMLQCVAGNGTIDAIFDSAEQFAAVAFVVDKNTTAGNDGTSGKDNGTPGKDNTSTGSQTSVEGNQTGSKTTQTNSKNSQTASTGKNTSKVAPKTGESETVPFMITLAVVLLIGGSYCLRKRKVN